MKVEVSLYGAYRDFDPGAIVVLELPDGASVVQLRAAVRGYATANWPGFRPALLAASAFASDQTVLRDSEPVPANTRMAVLPPVSGG